MIKSIELPKLDETRCTRCENCVWVCPVDCLEMDGPLPWLARPRDCISCSLCALICPTRAITMAEMEPA
jgi:NAD-dependent dihydropyrimidine dehydrogenase PreA subunit